LDVACEIYMKGSDFVNVAKELPLPGFEDALTRGSAGELADKYDVIAAFTLTLPSPSQGEGFCPNPKSQDHP